jgi:hypothetical protein
LRTVSTSPGAAEKTSTSGPLPGTAVRSDVRTEPARSAAAAQAAVMSGVTGANRVLQGHPAQVQRAADHRRDVPASPRPPAERVAQHLAHPVRGALGQLGRLPDGPPRPRPHAIDDRLPGLVPGAQRAG